MDQRGIQEIWIKTTPQHDLILQLSSYSKIVPSLRTYRSATYLLIIYLYYC